MTSTLPDAASIQAADDVVRRGTFRRLVRNPLGAISIVILLGIVALGLLAPVISPHDPNASSLTHVNAPVGTEGYPLGADASGRDILSRLLASINVAISSAAVGTGIAVALGTVAGLVAGYRGKRIDGAMLWVFNLIMTFPAVVLLIVLFPVTGGSYLVTMAIFGVLLAPGIFRLVRNVVVGVRHELYVDAARVSGLSDWRILSRHILYVVRGPVIIAAAFIAGACIDIQAGLAFLGLGSKATPSWGGMIASGFTNFYSAPLQFVWPSLMLGITTTALVLLGNAYRDALESSTSRSRRRRPARGVSAPAVETRARDDRDSSALLDVRNLTVAYERPDGSTGTVVDGVSFRIGKGEILGLVGESGSGKTQTAFSVLGLLPPTASLAVDGIWLDGDEISGLSERAMQRIRGRGMAYVPQEPMSNLDPCFTVGHQLVQGIRAGEHMPRRMAKERALELLSRVGIVDPARVFRSYPHEISGGMAQRVLIAGAISAKPKLLIADEPTTALDVTVQADILDLLRDLQSDLGMSILLVTHNFGVVADLCDRVIVMRSGTVRESGSIDDIFSDPKDAYTRMLLDSILDEDTLRRPLQASHVPAEESRR
jgi:peptide/nickel transport system permease protein